MAQITIKQIQQARRLIARGESDTTTSRLIHVPMLAVHCLRCCCDGLDDDAALERCQIAAELPDTEAIEERFGVSASYQTPRPARRSSKKSFLRRFFEGDDLF